jgi:hypothetical protein
MELKKSRDLPKQDFYTLLNLEYLGYYARYKIYKRPEDTKKFSDICQKKREKIEALARKECINTMFGNEDRKSTYIRRFVNEWGLPNFTYRDDYQKEVKGRFDKIFWFYKDTEVEVNLGDNSILRGNVSYINYSNDTITISVQGSREYYSTLICNARRIIEPEFFKDFI